MLFFMGCGEEDKIGPTLPVRGKVNIDGKPLQSGAVTFVPDDQKGNKAKISAQGQVKDGSFTLTSSSVTNQKEGAPPGWYKAIISTGGPMGGNKDVGKVGEAEKGKPPSVGLGGTGAPIAKKYTTFMDTPLFFEVKDGGTYDIEATSK